MYVPFLSDLRPPARLSYFLLLEDGAVPIVRIISSTHYTQLNFFSTSPSSALNIRAISFSLCFGDTLHNSLDEFRFWRRDESVETVDTRNVTTFGPHTNNY